MTADDSIFLSGEEAKKQLRLISCPEVIFIAGTEYSDIPSSIEQHDILLKQPNRNLHFVREQDNPYDSNAIRVELSDGRKIGYIPRTKNVEFARRMDNGEEVYGRFLGAESCVRDKWKIAVAIITKDNGFLPPVEITRPKIIPTKIDDMPEEERKLIHELYSWIPFLKAKIGDNIEEGKHDPDVEKFRSLLFRFTHLSINYLKTLEELFSYNLPPKSVLSYATYEETKAYLTFFIRADHFSNGAIECDIESGTYIPIIERLKIFADGD